MRRTRLIIFAVLLFVCAAGVLLLMQSKSTKNTPEPFSGESAYQFLLAQMEFGPRTPGSLAHQQTRGYITAHLQEYGWNVQIHETNVNGHPIINIIGSRGSGDITVIGAHYDSRNYASAESTEEMQQQPVPGANDGASGVAVLLELARTLPEQPGKQLSLVFFDAEDQGHIADWEWIMGSRVFVQDLTIHPSRVIILDMIGDSDLHIYREQGSDAVLTDQIWQAASDLGYSDSFVNEQKYAILDDHLPFIEAGIPAVDIIDFDYPWWHTTADTADKVSPQSLEIVGRTITHWLETNP